LFINRGTVVAHSYQLWKEEMAEAGVDNISSLPDEISDAISEQQKANEKMMRLAEDHKAHI
jgi:hypothetical protein